MASKPEDLVVNQTNGNKKKWLVGSILGLVALGLVAMAMINTIMPKLMPDKYVLVSIGKMVELAEEEWKDTGFFIPDHRRTSMDFTLKELEGQSAAGFKDLVQGLGLSVSLANSQEDHILIDAAIKQHNTSLMDLSIYSTQEKLGLKIPGLLDQYLMVNLAQFKEQYDQSDFPAFLGPVAQEDVDLLNTSVAQLRAAIIGDTSPDESAQDLKVMADEFEALSLAFIKDVSVKHTGSTHVTIGGKAKKANKFNVSIGGDTLKTLLGDSFDIAFRNSRLISQIPMDERGLSKEEIKTMFYDTLDQITFSDVEMVLLIDHQRRIVGIEMDTAMAADGEALSLSSAYYLLGSESIFDTMLADMTFTLAGENIQIGLETDKTYGNHKNKTAQDMRLKISENQTQLLSTYINITQDTKAQTDNFAIDAHVTADEAMTLKFSLSGDLVTNKGQKEASLKANEISLVADIYGDLLTVAGTGAFRIEDLKDASVTITQAQELDLFSLNLSQMLDIIGRVGKELYGIGNMMDQIY